MSDHDMKFFEALAENLESSVRFVDTEKRILYVNPYGERLLGYSMAEVVGKRCADFAPRHTDGTGAGLCETECLLDWSLKKGKTYEGRNFFRDKKNNTFPVEIRVLPVSNSKGTVIGVVEIMQDDRPRLELEELRRDIQRMIPVDLLTGLYTRHKIMEYLEVKVENAVRYGSPLGIMIAAICDLDSIKREFGGKKAEEVMQRVGYLFRMNMRRGDISGRLGPEQMLVLLPNTKEEETRAASEKMKRVIEEDSTLVIPKRVRIAIGTAQYVQEDTVATLLERAQKDMEADYGKA
jgi:diguanylate cyclase (GGDEF)-like protein/PAS domain S-box-containing protein